MRNKSWLIVLGIWLISIVVVAGILIQSRLQKKQQITSQATSSQTNSNNQRSSTPSNENTNNTQQAAKTYTAQDVAKHDSTSDCWLIVSGNVYDVTDFIPQHPGGQAIANYCGEDATRAFEGNRSHSDGETDSNGNTASQELSKHLVGKLST